MAFPRAYKHLIPLSSTYCDNVPTLENRLEVAGRQLWNDVDEILSKDGEEEAKYGYADVYSTGLKGFSRWDEQDKLTIWDEL